MSNYGQPCKNKNYGNFVSISSLTGECAAEKFKNFCSSSLWTCLHHMVILKSQNKITDFLMILAWASPFNSSFTKFAFMRNPHCVHASIVMEIHFIVCGVENRQAEWSVTWTQCSLIFLTCAMCACAWL